jgi:hypothetical protein
LRQPLAVRGIQSHGAPSETAAGFEIGFDDGRRFGRQPDGHQLAFPISTAIAGTVMVRTTKVSSSKRLHRRRSSRARP